MKAQTMAYHIQDRIKSTSEMWNDETCISIIKPNVDNFSFHNMFFFLLLIEVLLILHIWIFNLINVFWRYAC